FQGQIEHADVTIESCVGFTEIEGACFGVETVGELIPHRVDSTARPHSGFKKGDVVTTLHQFECRYESCDSCSDDHDFLWPRRGGCVHRERRRIWRQRE